MSADQVHRGVSWTARRSVSSFRRARSRRRYRARAALDVALKSAAKLYTHAEYLELERDIAAGKIDVRLYDDGLVLMRTGA
jgi:hypothetical protein